MSGHDIRIELASDPRLLASVRALVRGYVSGFGVPRHRVEDIVLAIDEACSNAIRHSYEGKTDGRLCVDFRSDADGLEFEVCDDGIPARPEHVEQRALAVPERAALTPGGLGVQFIHRIFDEVEFHPGPARGNRVVMRMRLSGHEGSDPERD
ncbi:MAG: ATP-binding protein [Candidatus Hydrogenedentes bacterium]|nr:ATP-binding protein [Candidatus Hydrogenedentota bacterium]